jgi:hypothetical protein
MDPALHACPNLYAHPRATLLHNLYLSLLHKNSEHPRVGGRSSAELHMIVSNQSDTVQSPGGRGCTLVESEKGRQQQSSARLSGPPNHDSRWPRSRK